MFGKFEILLKKKKGYIAVLLAVLIPIIISSFYLYVRYDGIDSEQTALSIATRDAALAAVSNYSTGVLVDKNNIDFDSQKKYLFRKSVNAFNSTIIAKRGLTSNVIPVKSTYESDERSDSNQQNTMDIVECASYKIYKTFFHQEGVRNQYRFADLSNNLGPEYPKYKDIIYYNDKNLIKVDQNDSVELQVPEYNDSDNQISSVNNEISIEKDTSGNSLLITTKIRAKTGDIEVDNNTITTKYRATPAKCNTDIILAVPTNHSAFTEGNSIADNIKSENYENTPIYAIKHALRRFVKKFMFYDGIRFGVIPYSGKVSVDAKNCEFIGTVSTFQYPEVKNFWPSDNNTKPEIPISNSYYVKGSCGDNIKNNFAQANTFHPVIGIMANENFFDKVMSQSAGSSQVYSSSQSFLYQPVDICYGGDISLYSGVCKKSTRFYPNPFPILPLTTNTYDVFSYLLLLNPYVYKDSPDQNLSNFLFLPFSIANLMFKEKVNVKQRDSTRKKIMIMIANHPDFFAPREMTFLGFDNDKCNIPLLDGERLNFEKYYENNGESTLEYKGKNFYNKVIENSELAEYRKKTRINVEGNQIPTYIKDNYIVTLPAPNPVRIAVKNVFFVQVMSDTSHGVFNNITLTEKYQDKNGNNITNYTNDDRLELKGFDNSNSDSTKIILTISGGKNNVTPVIAKLKFYGVKLESKNNGYIVAVDNADYDKKGKPLLDEGYVYICKKTANDNPVTGNSFSGSVNIELTATIASKTTYPVLSYAVTNSKGYLLSGAEKYTINASKGMEIKANKLHNTKVEIKYYKKETIEERNHYTEATVDNRPYDWENWTGNSDTVCSTEKKCRGWIQLPNVSNVIDSVTITSWGYRGFNLIPNMQEHLLFLINNKPLSSGDDSKGFKANYEGKDDGAVKLGGYISSGKKNANTWDIISGEPVSLDPSEKCNRKYLVYYPKDNKPYAGYFRILELKVKYQGKIENYKIPGLDSTGIGITDINYNETLTSSYPKYYKYVSQTLADNEQSYTLPKDGDIQWTYSDTTKKKEQTKIGNISVNIINTYNGNIVVDTGDSKAKVSASGFKDCNSKVSGMHIFFVPKKEKIIRICLEGCKLLSVEACNNLKCTSSQTNGGIEDFETKFNNLDVIKETLDLSSGKTISDNEVITYQDKKITIHKDSFDPNNGKLTIKVKKTNPTINGNSFSIYDLINRSGNTGDYELRQNSNFTNIGGYPSFIGAKLNHYWCTGYRYQYNNISLENPFLHHEWCWKFIFYVICNSYWVSTRRSANGASGTECIADNSSFNAKIKYGWVSECYKPLCVTIGGRNVYNTNYCDRFGETHNNVTVSTPGNLVASSKRCTSGSKLAKNLSISAEITSGITRGYRGLKFNKWPSSLGGSFSKLYANVTIPDSTIAVGSSGSRKIESDTETLEYVFSNEATNASSNAIKINPNNGEFSINIVNAEIVSIIYNGDAPVMYDRKTEPSINARWINFGVDIENTNKNSRPYMDGSIYDTFGSGGISSQDTLAECTNCLLGKCGNCDCMEECGVNATKAELEKFGISEDQSEKNACEVSCSSEGMEDPCKEVDVCNSPVCANLEYKSEENWQAALENFDEKYEAVLNARKNLGEIGDYEINNNWVDGIDSHVQDRFNINEDYTLDETSEYRKAKDRYEMNVEVYSRMQMEKNSINNESEAFGDGYEQTDEKVEMAYELPDYCMNAGNDLTNNPLGSACKQKVEDDIITNKIAFYEQIPMLKEEVKKLKEAIDELNKAENALEEHLNAGNGAYLTYDSGEKDISNITQFSGAKKENEKYEGDSGVLNYFKYINTETNNALDESGDQTLQTTTKTLFIYPKNTTDELPNDKTDGTDQKYYTISDKFITGILPANEVIIPETNGTKDYQNAYYRAQKLSSTENLIGSVICGKSFSFSSNNVEFTQKSINVDGGYIDPCIEIGEKDSNNILCSDLCEGKTKELHDAVINASNALNAAENAADVKYNDLQKALEDAEENLGTLDDVWDEDIGNIGKTAFARLKHYGVELTRVDDYDEDKKYWYNESCEDGLHNPSTPKYPAGTKLAICPEKCSMRQNENGNLTEEYQNTLDRYNKALVDYENMKNIIKLTQQKTETNEYEYNRETGYFETLKNRDAGTVGFNMALFPLYSTADITVSLENRYDLQKNEILSSYDIAKDTNEDTNVDAAEGLLLSSFTKIDYLNGLNNFFLPYHTENTKNAFVGPSFDELVNDDGIWIKIYKQKTRLVFAEFTNPINRVFSSANLQEINKNEGRKVTDSPTNVLANSALLNGVNTLLNNVDKIYFIIYNNNQLEYVKEKLSDLNSKNKIIYKTAKDKRELEKVLDEIAKEVEVGSPTAERIQ